LENGRNSFCDDKIGGGRVSIFGFVRRPMPMGQAANFWPFAKHAIHNYMILIREFSVSGLFRKIMTCIKLGRKIPTQFYILNSEGTRAEIFTTLYFVSRSVQ